MGVETGIPFCTYASCVVVVVLCMCKQSPLHVYHDGGLRADQYYTSLRYTFEFDFLIIMSCICPSGSGTLLQWKEPFGDGCACVAHTTRMDSVKERAASFVKMPECQSV